MKTFLKASGFIAVLAFSFILASCGFKSTVSPSKTEISGPLGDYFEVVDRTYKVIDGKVNIEFERIKDGMTGNWNRNIHVGWDDGEIEPAFTVQFRDKDGDIIAKTSTNIVICQDEIEVLLGLATGESSAVEFRVDDRNACTFSVSSTCDMHGAGRSYSSGNAGDVFDGIYNICKSRRLDASDLAGYSLEELRIIRNQIYAHHGYVFDSDDLELYFSQFDWYTPISKNVSLSAIEFQNVSFIKDVEAMGGIEGTWSSGTSGSWSRDSDDYAGGAGSADIDKMLNEFEKMIGSMESMAAKMSKGKLNAVADYFDMLSSMEKISDKVDKVEDDMSAAQAAKFNKLTGRMAKAEAQMASAYSKLYEKAENLSETVDGVLNSLFGDDDE